jgi:hypothetical protein
VVNLGLGTITAISAASGCVPIPHSSCTKISSFLISFVSLSEHRQSVVLFKSGCVLGFGKFEGELKQGNWLVPHSICTGAGGIFLLCCDSKW